ncbi:MAG: TPR end-of-group domain-containing protein [Phycisphaerales bacterium JB054]
MRTRATRAALTAALLISTTTLAPATLAQDARADAAPALQPATPTAQDARQLQAARQWDAAASAWASLARLDPKNGEAVFNLGYCLHMAGHIEQALEVHRRAAEFEQYRGLALYNTACAHALLGEPDAAISALEASADAGYSLSNARSDSDLDTLHNDPRFRALLDRPAPGIRGKFRQLMTDAEAIYTHYAPEIRQNLDSIAEAAEAQAQSLAQSIMQHERLGPIARRLASLVGADRSQPRTAEHPQSQPGTGPSLAAAQSLQQSGNWTKAADAYAAILDREPQHAAAAFGLAYCLHMSGNLAEAIPAHQRAATFPQFEGIALYNLGCAYALTNKPDQAFEALQKSLEAGFDLKRYLTTDTDLKSLHQDGRFAVLLARVNGGL